MGKAMSISMRLVCLLLLLIPGSLQAQLPVWIDFGAGGLTHSSSESSLTYWSFNAAVVHGLLIHQVAYSSGEEFLHGLNNLYCIGPCPPTEPKRLSSVSYALGTHRSKRRYVAAVLAGPALIWGNGGPSKLPQVNPPLDWPFSEPALSLRMNAQLHIMLVKMLGLGTGLQYYPFHRIAGIRFFLTVRIHRSPSAIESGDTRRVQHCLVGDPEGLRLPHKHK